MSSLPDIPELLPWHAPLWRQWLKQHQAGRTPHALLLSGPKGLGKQRFADYLCQGLVCQQNTGEPCGVCQACRLAAVDNHPDVSRIQPAEAGKMIKVEAIRQLIHCSGLTASTRRVFVLQSAEAMNASAANALLKTLEEPAPGVVMILITAAPQWLPATLRSRCQVLPFRPVAQDQAQHWLRGQQADVDWSDILAFTGAQPLLALQAHAEGWLDAARQTLQCLMDLRRQGANPVQAAKVLSERSVLTVIHEIHCICSDMAHILVADGQGRLFFPSWKDLVAQPVKQLDMKALLSYIDQLNDLRRQLPRNPNPTMLLEKLLIDWFRLNR